MFKNIFNYLKKFRPKKEQEKTSSEKSEPKKPSYPTIVIEESFTLEGLEGDVIFKIHFEVPVPIMGTSDKEEIERLKNDADATFRPIVVVLKHYLIGLCCEQSPERFLIGRDNLIAAIKQCAAIQLNVIKEAEKNR